jgi:hypothetical protein
VPADFQVVYDDGDLQVIDKPAGLPVLPAGGWLEHTLLRLLERRHRGAGVAIPRPVHRLGRYTSGLLVCARQPQTRAWLSASLRESTAAGLASAGDEAKAVGEAGGCALAAVLSGRRFYWLDLSSNRISLSTWDAIAMAASKGAFDRVTGMPLQHQLLCCLKAVDLTNLTITNQISMSSWEDNDSGTISHLMGMYPNGVFNFLSIIRSEGPLTNEETSRLSTIPFDDSRSVISSAASSPFKTVAALRDAWRSGLGCAFCSGGPCDNYVSHDSRDHVEENGRDSYLTFKVRQWNVCALCSSEISCEEGSYDERIPY